MMRMPIRLLTSLALVACFASCPRPDDSAPHQTSLSRIPAGKASLAQGGWTSLVARCGAPEVPRYIKHRELDPKNRTRVLPAPTLQRGSIGQPIVVRKDQAYLYSIAADGTFLVAEKRPVGSNDECGHPNLTGGKPARLSGELRHDPQRGKLVIDNRSGRYGYQLSRKRQHLAAACTLLERIGVRYRDGTRATLVERWVEPRRTDEYRLIDCVRPLIKGAPAGFDGNGWRSAFVSALGLVTAERTASCARLLARAAAAGAATL